MGDTGPWNIARPEAPSPPRRVAPGDVLDLDDLGAPVAQDRRGGGDEGVVRQVEDADSLHRAMAAHAVAGYRRPSAGAHGSVPLNVVDTDLRDASDAALVVAIARFRQEALAEAYRRHGDAAFGLAVRVLHDRALAEEIVQEVFLRLWNDPEKFDPGAGRCGPT